MNLAKEEAERYHSLVGETADNAQEAHDAMMGAYKESDAFRGEADHAQEKFVETKLAADEEHKAHVDLITKVHDYDKLISGIRQKEKKAIREKEDSVVKQEAEEIYERFKAGDKLSTEDLMILQKSGYL